MGIQEYIKGNLDCSDNRLKNMDYHPFKVDGYFDISNNPLDLMRKVISRTGLSFSFSGDKSLYRI